VGPWESREVAARNGFLLTPAAEIHGDTQARNERERGVFFHRAREGILFYFYSFCKTIRLLQNLAKLAYYYRRDP
jgi:hypothetical protein